LANFKIPLVDLKRQYASIKGEVDETIGRVLESSSFILGPEVARFEKEFAAFCGVELAVGVSSGTAALSLALLALGVKPGDEVITTPNTFIATAEAISGIGAVPVFVDIDPATYNMDPSQIASAVSQKTRAIIPVHLYGHPADMDPVIEKAGTCGLKVVEDACQAHGAEYKGKRTGSLGDIAAFSFYPGKNLGAYGDGGALTTSNKELVEQIRLLRDHGSPHKYYHDIIGYNSRLDEIQGAVLNVKLKHLDDWNHRRRKNARLYDESLRHLVDRGLVITQKEAEWAKHVYHLYVIQVDKDVRDRLIQHLNANGIGSQIHYPVPIHLQNAYKWLGHSKGEFPISEQIMERIVSLPMFPELEEQEIEFIVQKITAFLLQ
jgi:dTDP-4-amino-4,6-dideoxygalactose transaminase